MMGLLHLFHYIVLLIVLCLIVIDAKHHHHHKHHKKSTTSSLQASSCEVKPDGVEVIAEGKSFILSCHFNLPPKVCAWYHNSPDSSNKSHYDLTCTEARDGSGSNKLQKCVAHPRIAFGAAKHSGSMGGSRRVVSKKKMSKKQRMRIKKEEKRKRMVDMEENKNCVLRVAASSATDAGEWRLDAMTGPSKHNKKASHLTHTFLVTTSNKTSLSLETDRPMAEKNGALTYGNEEWVQIKAMAVGGRPKPNIKWTVDGKEINNELFRIVEQSGRCLDRLKLICEEESTIIFHASDLLDSSFHATGRRKREVEEKDIDDQVEVIENIHEVDEAKEDVKNKIEDLISQELPQDTAENEVKEIIEEIQDRMIKLTATAEQGGMGVVERKDVLIKITAK